MSQYSRVEVEEAWRHFVAVGDSGDWNAWADLHSEDGVWVEHHLGTVRGREAIRATILEVMKPVPMMQFPVGWHAIDGDRVVFYPWQVFALLPMCLLLPYVAQRWQNNWAAILIHMQNALLLLLVLRFVLLG